MLIRPAGPADREFVRRLSLEAFARFGDYGDLADEVGKPGVETWIAEDDTGRPSGFVMLATPEGHAEIAEISAIAVEADARGRGTGAALLDRAHRAAAERAVPPRLVALSVAVDNVPARSLFERAGYRAVPGAAGRYPRGQPSLTLVRPVPGGERPPSPRR